MFVILNKSAKVRGRAKQFGPYRHLAVVEIEDGAPMPHAINAKSVKRVVYDTGSIWAGGKTERSVWVQKMAFVTELAAAMNKAATPTENVS